MFDSGSIEVDANVDVETLPGMRRVAVEPGPSLLIAIRLPAIPPVLSVGQSVGLSVKSIRKGLCTACPHQIHIPSTHIQMPAHSSLSYLHSLGIARCLRAGCICTMFVYR